MRKPSPKAFYLNISTRLLLVVPAILLTFVPFALSMFVTDLIFSTITKTAFLIFCFVLSGICLDYAFTCRLVTTPDGLESQSFFPFRKFTPWNEFDHVEERPFGEVHLIPIYKENQKTKWTIVLSTFVSDWQNSELINEIKTYAQHINFPKEISNRSKTAFLYRSGTLLTYLAISMVFPFILFLIPAKIMGQIMVPWGHGAIACLVSALGAMEKLPVFSQYRDTVNDLQKVKKLTFLFYITPISGFVMTFLLSICLQVLRILPEDMNIFISLIALILGFKQLDILLKIFWREKVVTPQTLLLHRKGIIHDI